MFYPAKIKARAWRHLPDISDGVTGPIGRCTARSSTVGTSTGTNKPEGNTSDNRTNGELPYDPSLFAEPYARCGRTSWSSSSERCDTG